MHIVASGQSNFGYDDRSLQEDQKENSRDSVKQSDVKHERYQFQWKNDGVFQQLLPLDTFPDGIHNYNYIFKQSIANTYLGNYPSPYQSDIYMLRAPEENLYQLNIVRAYLFKPVDMINYNTTTPFTQLWYSSGGGRGKNETMLNVLHSQNINPYWNAGFRYNLISGDGRYMNQKSKAYNLSLFSSYERDRVAMTFFLNQNNGHFTENGGIQDKSAMQDTTGKAEKAENIPVNLGQGVKNVYRNFNIDAMGQYSLGAVREQISNNDTSYSYPAKVLLKLTYEDNELRSKENTVYPDFYHNTYVNNANLITRLYNKNFRAATKLVLNEHPKFKGIPGVYAGVTYIYDQYDELRRFDFNTSVAEYGKYSHNNFLVTAGIFNLDSTTRFNYKVDGGFTLLGNYIGNFDLDGYIQHAFNKEKSSYIQVDGKFSLETANPFFSRLISNHFVWENNFKDIKTIEVLGRYVNTRSRSELGVGINNTFGYIYLDTLALPRQETGGLIVLTAWAKQHFIAGKFHFDQTVFWQSSSMKEVLDLPMIAIYSHNYYQNVLFKNALKFQIGFDLYYNTSFYADNYEPGLMQFYNQRVEKTGNYPKLDLFLTLGIKRADIFVKYEHTNYLFTNGEYFSALDYPINPAMVKFGLRWNFFD